MANVPCAILPACGGGRGEETAMLFRAQMDRRQQSRAEGESRRRTEPAKWDGIRVRALASLLAVIADATAVQTWVCVWLSPPVAACVAASLTSFALHAASSSFFFAFS